MTIETNEIRIQEINEYLTANMESASEIWYRNTELGERLYLIKEAFSGNTKEFGTWLNANCPKLDVKLVSYYVKLAGHNEDQHSANDIREWLQETACQATNPRSCWDKFNKAHKTDKSPDETNGDVETIKPEKDNTDSLSARLESILTEIRDGVIQGTINDAELARLSDLSDKFSDVVEELQ